MLKDTQTSAKKKKTPQKVGKRSGKNQQESGPSSHVVRHKNAKCRIEFAIRHESKTHV